MGIHLHLFSDSSRFLFGKKCWRKTGIGIPILGGCLLSHLDMVCPHIICRKHDSEDLYQAMEKKKSLEMDSVCPVTCLWMRSPVCVLSICFGECIYHNF